MKQYYDVWQKESKDVVVPVEVDVEAASAQEACEIIAQERNIPVSTLQASEASNPGYREV